MNTNINSVRLTGYLGEDPQVKITANQKKMATFSLATYEYARNEQGEQIRILNWHPVVLWEGQASVAETYLGKGSKIAVDGRLVTRRYTDKNGVKHRSTEVQVIQMTFIDSKPPVRDRKLVLSI